MSEEDERRRSVMERITCEIAKAASEFGRKSRDDRKPFVGCSIKADEIGAVVYVFRLEKKTDIDEMLSNETRFHVEHPG